MTRRKLNRLRTKWNQHRRSALGYTPSSWHSITRLAEVCVLGCGPHSMGLREWLRSYYGIR